MCKKVVLNRQTTIFILCITETFVVNSREDRYSEQYLTKEEASNIHSLQLLVFPFCLSICFSEAQLDALQLCSTTALALLVRRLVLDIL